jgi:hypothetical protein
VKAKCVSFARCPEVQDRDLRDGAALPLVLAQKEPPNTDETAMSKSSCLIRRRTREEKGLEHGDGFI